MKKDAVGPVGTGHAFFVADLDALPRRIGMYPQIRRAGCYESKALMPSRRMTNLQICFRICGNCDRHREIIDGTAYEAGFPHLLIKRPGEVHETAGGKVRLSSFYFVYPAGSPVEGLLPPELKMAEIPFEGNLPGIFNSVNAVLEHADAPGSSDRLDELCFRFLFELVLMWKENTRPRINPESRIGRAVFWLRSHYTQNIDWENLAARFGFSLRSFQRHWRYSMKEPPGHSLCRFRMEEARRQLSESTVSVGELSLRLGYGSPEAFTKAFRHFSGETPLGYRKREMRRIVSEARGILKGADADGE